MTFIKLYIISAFLILSFNCISQKEITHSIDSLLVTVTDKDTCRLYNERFIETVKKINLEEWSFLIDKVNDKSPEGFILSIRDIGSSEQFSIYLSIPKKRKVKYFLWTYNGKSFTLTGKGKTRLAKDFEYYCDKELIELGSHCFADIELDSNHKLILRLNQLREVSSFIYSWESRYCPCETNPASSNIR